MIQQHYFMRYLVGICWAEPCYPNHGTIDPPSSLPPWSALPETLPLVSDASQLPGNAHSKQNVIGLSSVTWWQYLFHLPPLQVTTIYNRLLSITSR